MKSWEIDHESINYVAIQLWPVISAEIVHDIITISRDDYDCIAMQF